MKARAFSSPEPLEARIAPAMMTFSPVLLTYGATGGVVNVFTLAVSGSNYIFTDTEAITLNQGAIDAGFTGNNTTTITAPLSAFNAGALLLISLDDGNDTLNLNGLRHAFTLSNGADADTATINTGATAVNGTVSISAETTTITSLNGAAGLTISADTLAVNATVGVSGNVLVQPNGSGRPISLGAEVGTSLSLTTTEMGRLDSGTKLQIGNTSAGAITISAAISVATVLSLKTTAGVTETGAGALTVGSLAVDADTAVTLNGANNVTTLAAIVADAGADFAFTDATGFEIGTVDGIAGINTTAGNDTVTLTAGDVTQAAGADINTTFLELLGTGSFNLPNTGNDVVNLSANIGGALIYTDQDALNIGVAGGTDGITTSNDAVTIVTRQGFLTVQNDDGDATPDVDAGSGAVSLTAGGLGAVDQPLTILANAGVVGTGGVTLVGDNISIAATVNSGTATTTLSPFQDGTLISLGGADDTATLGLTDTELDFVTAGRVIVGSSASGTLTTTALVNLGSTAFLSLRTGGSITDGLSGTDIIETSLSLEAGTGIAASGNPLDTSVTNLEAQTTTGGIFITETGTVTIGGIASDLPGLRVLTSGDLSLTATGSITLGDTSGAETVKGGATSGDVTVTAIGATSDISGATSNEVALAPGGSITFDAGRDILLGAGGFDQDVLASVNATLNAGRDVVVEGSAAVRSDDFGNTTGGSVFITAGRDISIANGTQAQVIAEETGGVTLTTGANGIFTLASTSTAGLQSVSGNVTVNADRIAIAATASFKATSGIVTLQPVTAGRLTNLGSETDAAANTLELSAVELNRITTPTLRIGSATAGALTVSAAVSRTPATALTATGSITVAAALTLGNATLTAPVVNVANGGTLSASGTATGPINVLAGGTLAPGTSPGRLNAAGATFAATSVFAVEINGIAAGTQYDQLAITGTVNVGGATLAPTLGFVPVFGDEFILIDNDGDGTGDDVTGTFAGLDEDEIITIGGRLFSISYAGGDGNDVTLSVVPLAVELADNKKSATYTDVDGDLVTVKASKGFFDGSEFIGIQTGANGEGQLQALNLDGDFKGAKITFKAKQQDANNDGTKDGNKLVNVGAIIATGVDLGGVKLPGDLGQIDAGNPGDAAPALLSLEVQSLGALGLATQAPAGSLHSDLNGDLTKLTVKGSINTGVTLAVAGRIGTAKITGDLTGATITALGLLSPVDDKAAVGIKKLTIGGNVANSQILAGYNLAKAAVNADVSIGTVSVNGMWTASDLVAGIADSTANGFGRNDTRIVTGGFAGGDGNIIAKIASLTIKLAATGSGAPGTDFFGITAEQIVKAKINGAAVGPPPLDENKNTIDLDSTNLDFRLVEL